MTSTICVGTPFSLLIGALTVIYLATGVYLWRYLRKNHPSVSEWMGSPIFSRPTLLAMKSSVYTLWFALSVKPEELRDPALIRVAWTFRTLLALIVTMA